MLANLYLHPDTFVYNGTDTQQQVADKLSALVTDMRMIITDYSDENVFKVPESLLSVFVFETKNIVDLVEECLENDQKGIFYSMLADTSDSYDEITIQDLRNKCKYDPNETEINSILVFNVPKEDLSEEEQAVDETEAKRAHKSIEKDYITFDDYKVVYDKHTWMSLRRQILGNHPGSPDFFIGECKKYFPNIAFHSNCTASLDDGEYKYLEIVPRRLVYYLSCLNDQFHNVKEAHKNISPGANSILEDFSSKYGLDEPGSLEMNPEKKESLSFSFHDANNNDCKICCEPHLKISQADSNYPGSVNYSTFHPRIYFNFGDSGIEHGKILVGSMGKHL
jgi:hypothetical protein